ncbi:ABC transporter substrate-binding protein [Microlunatus flavus]|uniref:Peptide/nickel transport system substrate-binding protein n=1 Tax=Microlunatus flavus TaxID=1036181 RepID=A0A1H9IZ24_9ACTN|nr:ABC transporter substrate-binding protein [Microlunatus flavus]SEQ79768.1 peptide/nickel transport system substrate-binding protein [Microlunatus flavus]
MTRSPRRSRRLLLAAPAAAVLLGLAACGGTAAAGGGGGDDGGTFRFALASDPSCLNPRVSGNNDAAYPSRQLVDSLTDQDPETGAIKPWLASSFAVNKAATQFTFTLRDGVTFSDGTPLTADVVKQNFDEIISHGAAQAQSLQFLTGYQRTVVVDDTTARVEFGQPNAQFLQATASHFLGLLAPSSLAVDPVNRCDANIVGTGPFVLDHYTRNTEVVETRRAGYAWGSSLWTHTGEAASARLEFKVIPEAAVRSGSLKSGQVDAIGGVPPQDESTITAGGVTLQVRPNPGQVFTLTPNVRRPALKDVRVRQALSLAVDRASVVKAALSPSYKPATSPVASTTPGYVDLSSRLTYDPERAKTLLDAAGWVPGADGIREKDGQRLTLVTYWATNFNPNQAALELIQQQARQVGIEIDLNSVPIGELQAKLATGDFDLSWGNSTRPDPDILRNTYWRDGTAPYGITDAALVKALKGQQTTVDARSRAADAATAQKVIVDQALGVPVFELTTVLGLRPGVTGVRFDSYSRLQLVAAAATRS